MDKFLLLVFFLSSPVSCRTQANISRELRNEGFHRGLVTTIEIYSTSESYPCHLLLVEYLPSSVYIDADEILGLVGKTGFSSFLNTTVNVEATADSEKAIPFKAFIYPAVQEGPKVTRSVELPVHLRYQAATKGGAYKKINIGQSSLYSRCAQDTPEISTKKFDLPCSPIDRSVCKWIKLDAIISPTILTASVPVGNTDLGLYVSFASFALLYGATYFIAKAIYLKKHH